ncbi:MAG: nucleoside 2-deoxyribosyltransferase [Candidatus Spechtbacterales bacterium]|nr:nucleoside 2-deoxyribosyltransferase [Candidatus Spechtbacterales bacterium]
MTNKPLVYLAGPITGLGIDDATDWRNNAIEKLAKHNIDGLSPIRGKKYLLLEKTDIKDSYEDEVLGSQKGITTRDHFDVMRSDMILVNFTEAEKVSIGSVMEIAWAHAYRKPIVLAMQGGNPHDHAMVREVSGFTLSTLEEALEVIVAILSPDVV